MIKYEMKSSLQLGGMEVLRARFLLTSGHLVATCLADMEVASVVAYLSFAVTFGSLFAGFDIFSPTKNALHILCHFLGGVLVCQVNLHDLDSARYLWYVVLLVHVPTLLCTLDTIVQLYLFKTARHSY